TAWPPEAAFRRLGQELHAARVAGAKSVRIVTGRGWGNGQQEPILRRKVEAWLAGPEGSRFRIRDVRQHSGGGALDVTLG
ncbi:MAG: Smr/MutS family protein, partial [Planctomycetota bacterium]